MVYLDTQIAVWLAAGETHLLTDSAKNYIDNHDLLISPMVYLEFEYLKEKGYLNVGADRLFSDLSTTFGLSVCTYPFAAVCKEATQLNWTRDPFDRVITGHASIRNAKLVTADRTIRQNYSGAVW